MGRSRRLVAPRRHPRQRRGDAELPEQEGDLTRTGVAADGKSCQYHGDEDEDVTLSLMALNGQTAQAAMGPMEADLARPCAARSGPPR